MRNDLYMITCSARTGSSFLETSLLSHPDVMSHGEVYDPKQVSALRGRYTDLLKDDKERAQLTRFRDEHQTAFLFKYVYDAQGHAAVGHKLKHEELLLPKFAETREAIRYNTDIKIIHLRRENLFARFVSKWVAMHVTGKTEIHSEADRPEIERVTVPFDEVQKDLDEAGARYEFFRRMFADHPSLELTYEGLTGPEGESILADVQRFVGVEPQSLNSHLKKVITKDMREVVENYDELRDRFSNTPHARFFEERS